MNIAPRALMQSQHLISGLRSKIYLIREEKVMLDQDLALLYGVQTKVLNQAVTRNLDRFPSDFMFQLTETEFGTLRSQTVTSKDGKGGRRYLPRVFTEQGVAMLSTVLGSKEAIQVNILIMRTFVGLRSAPAAHSDLLQRLDRLETKYDGQFEVVFEAIRELVSHHAVPRKRIIGLNRK